MLDELKKYDFMFFHLSNIGLCKRNEQQWEKNYQIERKSGLTFSTDSFSFVYDEIDDSIKPLHDDYRIKEERFIDFRKEYRYIFLNLEV